MILAAYWFVFMRVLAAAGPALSKHCESYRSDVPFSGYKVQYQYTNQGSFHLYMCHNGKVISNINLNQSIPYGQEIAVAPGWPKLVLARSKTSVNIMSGFMPGQTIGGLFERNNTESTPLAALVTENAVRHHWVEFPGFRRAVLHVPILATLDLDSPRREDMLWINSIDLESQKQYSGQSADLANHIVKKIIPVSIDFLSNAIKNGVSLFRTTFRDGAAVLLNILTQ